MQDVSWAAGKKMMGNVDQFLKSLIAFDKVRVFNGMKPVPPIKLVPH